MAQRGRKKSSTDQERLDYLYGQFFELHDPIKIRIGTLLYDRILDKKYKEGTMVKLLRLMDRTIRFMDKLGGSHAHVIGKNNAALISVVCDSKNNILYFVYADGDPVYPTMENISANSVYCGATTDLRDSDWFKKYGHTFEIPGEENEVTALMHKAGDKIMSAASTERWFSDWVGKAAAKHDDVTYEEINDVCTAELPVPWMYMTEKKPSLMFGCGRLDREPECRIEVPEDGNCTIIEHIGGRDTATVYAGEEWSRKRLHQLQTYFPKSVGQTVKTKTGEEAYVIPAGWMKLTPPSVSIKNKFKEQ